MCLVIEVKRGRRRGPYKNTKSKQQALAATMTQKPRESVMERATKQLQDMVFGLFSWRNLALLLPRLVVLFVGIYLLGWIGLLATIVYGMFRVLWRTNISTLFFLIVLVLFALTKV